MLHGVFQHTVAHDPAILNGETGGKRDLRQAKESRSRGAGLRGVAVNGVLAEQQQVIVAYLLRRLCKRVRGRKSVSAAERAVRQQVRLIAPECERLFSTSSAWGGPMVTATTVPPNFSFSRSAHSMEFASRG